MCSLTGEASIPKALAASASTSGLGTAPTALLRVACVSLWWSVVPHQGTDPRRPPSLQSATVSRPSVRPKASAFSVPALPGLSPWVREAVVRLPSSFRYS